MHRDLKPENLLLSKNGEVKISDFGFSKMLSPDLAATYCGSPYYTAPEILRGTPYVVNAADIWSLGIVLYSMLTGCLPFNGKNVADLLDRITRKKFQVPDYLLPSEVDLLHRLLEVDASKRITLDELLEHEWVIAGPDGTTQLVTLSAGATSAGGDMMAALPGPDTEQRINIAKIEGQVKASSIKQVSEFAEKHPEESVAILRSWLHESA